MPSKFGKLSSGHRTGKLSIFIPSQRKAMPKNVQTTSSSSSSATEVNIVKGSIVVNKTEVNSFLEFPFFLYDPVNVGNLISGSSAFLKSSLNICKFSDHILLKLNLKDFRHNLLACEMSTIVWQCEHSLSLPFLGIGMKMDLFQSYDHF